MSLISSIERRDGVLSAYLPTEAVFRDGGPQDLAAVLAQGRRAGGVFGLGIEIGTGSIKLYGRSWRGTASETTINIKIASPKPSQGDIAGLVSVLTAGLGCISPERLDPAAPETAFADFEALQDFAFAYGTQGLRDHGRRADVLPGVRVLSADEEGLVAFDSIVPPEARQPGAVAVEIGSGSTEIIRVDTLGILRPLGIGLGGRSDTPPIEDLRRFLACGEAGHQIFSCLESPDEGVAAFQAAGPARQVFVNPSRASAAFRAFAGCGHEGAKIDAGVVDSFCSAHPDDGFTVKAKILLVVVEALGLDRFYEGQAGGLKAGMAEVIGRGLAARWPEFA